MDNPVVLIAIIGIVILLGYLCSRFVTGPKKMDKLISDSISYNQGEIKKILDDNKFVVTSSLRIETENSATSPAEFYEDEEGKRFAIASVLGRRVEIFNYNEILGIEVVEKRETITNVSKVNNEHLLCVVVNGFKMVSNQYVIDIVVHMKNTASPAFTLKLIDNTPQNTDPTSGIKMLNFANAIKQRVEKAI